MPEALGALLKPAMRDFTLGHLGSDVGKPGSREEGRDLQLLFAAYKMVIMMHLSGL